MKVIMIIQILYVSNKVNSKVKNTFKKNKFFISYYFNI